MGTYPKGYDKNSFIKFLNENKVSIGITEKFKTLPEKVIYRENEYKLNIVSTWFSVGDTFYNFEINYYCDKEIEFLFGYKIFKDVELSIDFAIKELEKLKLL